MKGPWKISRVDRLNFYPLPFFRSRKKGKERKEKQNDEANENIDAHTLERTRMGENFACNPIATRSQNSHCTYTIIGFDTDANINEAGDVITRGEKANKPCLRIHAYASSRHSS